MPGPVWLLPTIVFGLFLYVRSRRWTDGSEFRRNVQLDLQSGTAVAHHVRLQDAILFNEREDEGPIVFLLTDAGETLVFAGQDLAREVARGFPWKEFDIRESANSRLFLGLRRRGERLRPSAVNPPLSAEKYKQLDLGSIGRWKRLEVPFEHLRALSVNDDLLDAAFELAVEAYGVANGAEAKDRLRQQFPRMDLDTIGGVCFAADHLLHLAGEAAGKYRDGSYTRAQALAFVRRRSPLNFPEHTYERALAHGLSRAVPAVS